MSRSVLALLAALLTVPGCTSGPVGVGGTTENKPSGESDKISDETEGVPGYLTCRWASVESETDVAARCEVRAEADGVGTGADYEWAVVSAGGAPYTGGVRVNAGRVATLVLAGRDIVDAKVAVNVAGVDVVESLAGLLAGLGVDGRLRACLLAGDAALAACFDEAAISLGPQLKGASLGFVTSGTHTGKLGGVAGGDEICRGLGERVGATYLWKAVLSDGGRSWTDVFPEGGPVLSLNGDRILADGGSVTFVAMESALTDDFGVTAAGPLEAWLGLGAGGAPAPAHCAGWSSASPVVFGHAVLVTGPQFAPDCDGACACDGKKRLICGGVDP